MKRMVKNGDLLDVKPDGSITVAGKPIGGGGDRELTLTIPYSSKNDLINNKTYVDDDIWNKINECYYSLVKIQYNDGSPLGIFNALHISMYQFGISKATSKNYIATNIVLPYSSSDTSWYGSYKKTTAHCIFNVLPIALANI